MGGRGQQKREPYSCGQKHSSRKRVPQAEESVVETEPQWQQAATKTSHHDNKLIYHVEDRFGTGVQGKTFGMKTR